MVYIHLCEGFEEIEAITVLDILKRGSVTAEFVSLSGENIVKGSHDIKIWAEVLFSDADYDNCEMIVLPGGMPGAINLSKSIMLLSKIVEFANSDKYVAAICAAPMVLGIAGILNDKNATIYPGMEEHINMAKAIDENVVVDGNIITSRGPGTAIEFALKLLELIKGKEISQKIEKGLIINGK